LTFFPVIECQSSADSWSANVTSEILISVDRTERLIALAISSRRMNVVAMMIPSGRARTLSPSV